MKPAETAEAKQVYKKTKKRKSQLKDCRPTFNAASF